MRMKYGGKKKSGGKSMKKAMKKGGSRNANGVKTLFTGRVMAGGGR